jgi:hypothetical protein
MNNNNPYINAYLQAQQGQAQQMQTQQGQGRPVHPQQSQYIPQYKMQHVAGVPGVPAAPVQPSIQKMPPPPREYTQFPSQQPQYGAENFSGLNVFDQQVMKHSLETEKVEKVARKAFESHVSVFQKEREEIDRELEARRASAVAPTTIKVEKKPIADLDAIAERRNKEAAQLKVEKVTNDASSLLGAMAVKKTDPNQLNKQMDDLIKRRQMEMQNIKYN